MRQFLKILPGPRIWYTNGICDFFSTCIPVMSNIWVKDNTHKSRFKVTNFVFTSNEKVFLASHRIHIRILCRCYTQNLVHVSWLQISPTKTLKCLSSDISKKLSSQRKLNLLKSRPQLFNIVCTFITEKYEHQKTCLLWK